jgi:site-specific DNA-methyltransferase (adenine-specific)
LIKPYYQDDWCTIYHGDCLEIMPQLEPVDLVLTDPPYGIGDKWIGGSGKEHGWYKSHVEKPVRNEWDSKPPSKEHIEMLRKLSELQIIWGGNYFELPVSRCWLVWNKPERGFTLAEAELAWTNADNVIRVSDLPRHEAGRLHPTQKPLNLMLWCLNLVWARPCDTILDPFMGSGTTLVAAKQLNRKSIGIEIEEKYCEIAVRRLQQEVFDFR